MNEHAGIVYVGSNKDAVPEHQVYALKLDGSNAKAPVRISQGDRIAQLLIVPVSMLQCVEVNSLDDTVRGDGGFGSTGR